MTMMKKKTKSRGKITISKFLPNNLKPAGPTVASCLVSNEVFITTTPAPIKAAAKLTAELLIMVLIVVVTVEIMLTHLLRRIINIEQAFVNT